MMRKRVIPVTKIVMMNQIKRKIISTFIFYFFCFQIESIMSVKEKLNQKIQGKPVFVISKSYCPFCVKGKNVLKKYNIKPEALEIMEIENDPDMNEIQVMFFIFYSNVVILFVLCRTT